MREKIFRCVVLCSILFFGVTSVLLSNDFRISFGSFQTRANAEALQREMRSAGFRTELETVSVDNRFHTRVLLADRFASNQEAMVIVQFLQEHEVLRQLAIDELWISGPEFRQGQLEPMPEPEPELVTPHEARSNERFEQRINPENGVVTGTIREATTGQPIPDVVVRDDQNNETMSEETGFFALETPTGERQIAFIKPGYNFSPVRVDVGNKKPTILQENMVVGSREMHEGEIRFVLTWGEYPHDLDIHLITPSGHHINFANKTLPGAGANLDIDDMRSYGPETITISDVQAGEYQVFVHNYSGTPAIIESQATVDMYTDEGHAARWEVPESGEGDTWLVGEGDLLQGDFRAVNEIYWQ